MGYRKGRGAIKVPLHYYAFDDQGDPTTKDGTQVVDTYTAHLKRRSNGDSKERTFDEAIEQNSRDSLSEFCGLIEGLEGFDDFPESTPETIGDVAFEYFNDPEVVHFVDQFMLRYSRHTMPAEFFRDFQARGVEVPVSHEESSKAGT